MEESLEARVGGALVVDELDLDRLHRGHGQDSLADAGSQAAEKSVHRREVTALVHTVPLELLERPESGDRGEESDHRWKHFFKQTNSRCVHSSQQNNTDTSYLSNFGTLAGVRKFEAVVRNVEGCSKCSSAGMRWRL